MMNIIEADLTWTGERFESGVQIAVGDDGRIAEVGTLGRVPDQRLAGRALLPGMVNAHSHAFQRGLRGRGETFPAGSGNFWTWREAMYALVGRLDSAELYALSLQGFREMRAAGITTVGEFHYVHHRDPEAADYGFDGVVLAAAAEAGIRVAFIQSYYRTGAVGQPLAGAQRRFDSPSPARYWEQMDRLAARLDPRRESLAASVHSLRAAGIEDLAAIYAEARRRDLPFHIHVEEQELEIADVIAYYGRRPMALLLDTLGTATDLTAVHCTHTDGEEMERFLSAGGRVCLCPLTEGNLGDGIATVSRVPANAPAFCLGSDSNARISPIEEMRWLEYVQRLATESRGVLRNPEGPEGNVAAVLLAAATAGGAAALGVEAGRIAPVLWADFAAIDLHSPLLAGWNRETLLESVIFGATEEVVAATAVGGVWVEHRGVLSETARKGRFEAP
jgi:formimidoylglutamate deiminase